MSMCLILKLNRKGSFLIEVLIIISILSTGLTLIIGSYLASMRAGKYISDYSRAAILLESKMADLMQSGFIQDGVSHRKNFSYPNEKFDYRIESRNIAEQDGPGVLNEVVVTISWVSGTKNKNLKATTYLFTLPQ